MRVPVLLRSLTPAGWALVMVGILGMALIGLRGLGFRWDPLGLAERRTQHAEARASVAVADAAARRIEIEVAANQTRRLEDVHQQAVAVARTTARTTEKARSSHDAETALDPDRAARLVEHDRELCRISPPVCRSTATDPSPGG